MTDSTYTVDPTYLAVENAELPEAPRFLYIRVSLESAQLQDRELRRLAKSTDPADTQRAVAILQSEAIAAPAKELIPSCWDHPNASYWLIRARADSRAFIYSKEELCRYSLLRRRSPGLAGHQTSRVGADCIRARVLGEQAHHGLEERATARTGAPFG